MLLLSYLISQRSRISEKRTKMWALRVEEQTSVLSPQNRWICGLFPLCGIPYN
jgi:hypothetical protein